MGDRLMTIEDVAELTGLTVRTLYNRRSNGTGPRAMNLGRTLRFRRQDVEDWLESYADGRPEAGGAATA